MISLVEELPYACAVETENLSTTCSACFATEAEGTMLLKCTGCKVVYYCKKSCQANDWPDHKLECKLLRNCSTEIPLSTVRLISRIDMKIARGDTSKAFNGRTIDDLMDHKLEMQEDIVADQNAARKYVFCQLTKYRGKNSNNDFLKILIFINNDQFLSFYGKININGFTIHGDLGITLGKGLYLGISIHNHSCSPDCFVIFDGPKAIFRTPTIGLEYSSDKLRPVAAATRQLLKISFKDQFVEALSPLTVSYVFTMRSRQKRREELKEHYYFDCDCELCEDCTQDQWRQSIVCACCKDGVCLLNPTADQLSCNICKTISPTSVADALAANDELNYILSNTLLLDVQTLSAIDMHAGLQFAIEVHEKLKKVIMFLSQFNIALVAVVERISTLSLMLEDNERIEKYALTAMPANKKYLPVGNPYLTALVMKSAIYRGSNDSRNPLVLQLYEEAYKLALLSHGAEHRVAVNYQAVINGFHNGNSAISESSSTN